MKMMRVHHRFSILINAQTFFWRIHTLFTQCVSECWEQKQLERYKCKLAINYFNTVKLDYITNSVIKNKIFSPK